MADADDAPIRSGWSGRRWASIIDDWPDPVRTENDFAVVRATSTSYFSSALPGLGEQRALELVDTAIEQYRAAWYADTAARRRRGETRLGPSAGDLAAAVQDAVLDAGPGRPVEHRVLRPDDREDERLALRAMGAKPALVRAGLTELAREERPIDFLVITQYLDLVDGAPTTPPRSSHVIRRLGGATMDEEDVQRAIKSFHERLGRIKERDERR